MLAIDARRDPVKHDRTVTIECRSPEDAMSAQPSHRVSLIDGFRVQRESTVLELPRSCQRLVAFLALRDRPVLRSYVSGTLWADSDIEHANASLRSALWRVPADDPAEFVVATPTHLSLGENVLVDIQETMTWAKTVVSGSAGSQPALWTFGEISALSGEMLPDWYDNWVMLARERFRQLRLHALESLCDQLAAGGRFAEALLAGLGAVAIEPLRESAHRCVIAVHLKEANYIEALRQYRNYEALLRDELSLTPSLELRTMLSSFLNQDVTA
jgi:DNA-binding SARP family transcriptional activator